MRTLTRPFGERCALGLRRLSRGRRKISTKYRLAYAATPAIFVASAKSTCTSRDTPGSRMVTPHNW